MAITIHRFDQKKVLEAIVLIAEKAPSATYHKISKLFYFADKLHLERYGNLVSEDTYCALRNGPVPSRIYDMMKYAADQQNALPAGKFPEILEAFRVHNNHFVTAIRAANLDYLTPSEIECLNESIELHGAKSFNQLTDESHDAAWGSVAENSPIPLQEIVKILPNAEEVSQHIYG